MLALQIKIDLQLLWVTKSLRLLLLLEVTPGF